ncbi:MAG: hypothetical protein JW993_14875 [Sedimentisphaerales bacterium]|nr:hypothetical protein [Sedimentisphaerales bacterium]
MAEPRLGFRILRMDSEDQAGVDRSMEAYHQHLDAFNKTANSDLWKFFYWDFFHDGSVESIEIQGDLKTVVIRLKCPNIKRFKSDNDYEYINVMFQCTSQTVSTLTIQYEKPEHSWDVRRNPTCFLYGEINTASGLSDFGPQEELDEDHHYSLLMLLMADDSVIWLEMIFSQVDVIAEEPTAFALMESDPKFQVPTWSADNET